MKMSVEQDIKQVVEKEVVPQARQLNWRNIGIAGGLLAAWAYTGFMGPGTLMNGFIAKSECVRFAKEKNMAPAGDIVEAWNLRIRNGKWVADVVGRSNSTKDLSSRVCVVDADSIVLPSLFENPFWR
jgi:hypothetical protein